MSVMLPHSLKTNRDFHNFARELLPLLGPNYKPPRLVPKTRPHPKNISGGGGKEGIKSGQKYAKKTTADTADTTSIPDPVPDTSIGNTSLAPPAGSSSFILPPVSQALSAAEAAMSRTTTAYSPTTAAMTSMSLAPSSTSSASTSSAEATSTHQKNSYRLSTASAVLISVGSAFALLGILVLFKICSRPRKRIHPIPSNPILQEDDYSDKYSGDESPIFGGKDRLSGTNSGHTNSTLWPWTQYHSGIPKPVPASTQAQPGSNSGGPVGYVATEHEKEQYPFTGLSVPGANQKNMLQPVQNAVTRVASRLSTVSMSLYPNSPRDPRDVGVAIDGGSYIADNFPVPKHMKSRPRRSSTIGLDSNRVTAYTRYSQGSTFNGVDLDLPALPITSQSLPKIAIAPPNNSGRARVKSSYYAPGAYPRGSNLDANLTSAGKKGNIHPFPDSLEERRPLQRSGSRRERDTRALTSALGLGSPVPSSPQPTLYPDDSLSMVGEHISGNVVRDYVKPALKAPVIRHRLDTPPVDSSATLGSLMLVDFGSGLPTMKSFGESLVDQTSHMALQRADDKPPRVPSPPPLPSLTQMGLAHANPEAFANYRSPTYSIYGLYEADRKSKATSFGY